jgi:branched-chain amino acid transport system permease protein
MHGDLRSLLRAGAVAGSVTIFLALVGLTSRFKALSLVGTQVTFGRLMLLISSLVAGAVLARPRVEGGRVVALTIGRAVRSGAVVGAAAGSVFALFALFVETFGVEKVGSVFVNMTPSWLTFVTFGQPIVTGVFLLVGASTFAAMLAAGHRTLPDRLRKPIGAVIVAVLAMGFLQRIVPIAMDKLKLDREWLYARNTKGLTWIGALAVAAVALALSELRARKGAAIMRSVRGQREEGDRIDARPAWVVAALVVSLALPYVVGPVVSEVLGTVLVFALLGLGLNLVVGYAGLLDLGYVFFFAVGAYALALLTGATLNTFTGSGPPAVSAHLSFFVAVPIVMVLAAVSGLLIGGPVLRLRGDYLALVTLGLGETITVLVRSPWFVPLVGGPNGMRNITDAAIGDFGFRDPQHFYYLALVFVLFAMFVSWRLINSRIGRAWTAMREDEQIAEAMGVGTTRYKLLAFAMGGAIGSLGGALFAVKIGSLTPASFEVLVSIQVLGIVILGGLGSLPGVVVGALVLVGLPGLLREFEEYRLLAYGAAVVAVMLLRPEGLVPNVRRTRELHEEDRAQDRWAGDLPDEHVAAPLTPEGPGSW